MSGDPNNAAFQRPILSPASYSSRWRWCQSLKCWCI